MTFKEVYDNLPDGWLREEEAMLLWDTVLSASGDALEIGTYLGRSAVLIGSALRERGDKRTLTCCDPFIENFEEGVKTPPREEIIQSLHNSLVKAGLVTDKLSYTVDVWAVAEEVLYQTRYGRVNYGFLYVDCDHSYEATFGALCRWVPLCSGPVACHDYMGAYPTVNRAVNDTCRKFNRAIKARASSMVVI